MKKIIGYLTNFFMLVLVGITIALILPYINLKVPYKPMTVLSGSMSPKINAGDMIINRFIRPSAVNVGDIITFKTSENIFVTHRVIDITKKEGILLFKTKGDANQIEDFNLVSEQQLVGKMMFNIHYIGYLTSFISSRIGIVIFIIIPAFLLLLNEIRTILSELKRQKLFDEINEDNVEI